MQTDDYTTRNKHLKEMSDEKLRSYFWDLVDKIIEPIIDEAKTHTSPSLERSILLRMGFSSMENKVIVDKMLERGLLGHGAGKIILQLAKEKNITVRLAGMGLMQDELWEDVKI
ncbi:MAG: D-ornithine 4,5-aminomutase subunit alpha [Desulforhopalus sp.]|jgi:D-ornithine 4,5-aminomutase subunit alpha